MARGRSLGQGLENLRGHVLQGAQARSGALERGVDGETQIREHNGTVVRVWVWVWVRSWVGVWVCGWGTGRELDLL